MKETDFGLQLVKSVEFGEIIQFFKEMGDGKLYFGTVSGRFGTL